MMHRWHIEEQARDGTYGLVHRDLLRCAACRLFNEAPTPHDDGLAPFPIGVRVSVKTSDVASLHEKAVQKVASDNITGLNRSREEEYRPRTSIARQRNMLDGVDPAIRAAIPPGTDLRRVRVLGPRCVVIENNPV